MLLSPAALMFPTLAVAENLEAEHGLLQGVRRWCCCWSPVGAAVGGQAGAAGDGTLRTGSRSNISRLSTENRHHGNGPAARPQPSKKPTMATGSTTTQEQPTAEAVPSRGHPRRLPHRHDKIGWWGGKFRGSAAVSLLRVLSISVHNVLNQALGLVHLAFTLQFRVARQVTSRLVSSRRLCGLRTFHTIFVRCPLLTPRSTDATLRQRGNL